MIFLITIPKVIQICAGTFFKPPNFFLQKVEKWPNVSRACPAQKSQGFGLRLVYSKIFSRATFFVFWGTHSVDRFLNYLFWVICLWNKFCRKSTVWTWGKWIMSLTFPSESSRRHCIKVHIFWEGHKILRNLLLTFVQRYFLYWVDFL